MKKAGKIFIFMAIVGIAATSCQNRDAEKRIAQLEARIAELEGQKKVTNPPPVATPAVQTPESKPEGPLAAMQYDVDFYDFGTIKEGEVVEHTYRFKNTGSDNLIIQHAQGSCGCTVPTWSKDPVPVGGSGFITAKFDSKGKVGFQEKTVTVTANTYPQQTVLKFKANVVAK